MVKLTTRVGAAIAAVLLYLTKPQQHANPCFGIGYAAEVVNDTSEGVLLEVVLNERQLMMDAADGLDAKSGVLLGFAGVIVGLAAGLDMVYLRILVVVPALACGILAACSLRVRKYPILEPQALRDKYLETEPRRLQRILLDTLTDRHALLDKVIRSKARCTQWATWALVAAIVLMAVVVMMGAGQ